jgi:Calcineurin-like phosphoesterase
MYRNFLRLSLLLASAISVAAVGGAGSVASTAVASLGTANLWVDPNGGSCTRQPKPAQYVDAQACASVASAYDAASSGDRVVVTAGSYGRQVVPAGTKRLTIKNAAGARPVFGTTTVDGSNITLVGVSIVRTDDPGPFTATLEANGSDNVFDAVTVDSKFMETPGTTHGRQGIFARGDNNVFRNGSTSNVVNDKGAMVGGNNVTFDNFDFHDVRVTDPAVHNECVYSLGPNLTVRNSHFWHCATMDLFITRGDWYGQPLYGGVTLINNVFEHANMETGFESWHYYSLGINGGVIQEMRNWRVVNNTFETTVSGEAPAPGTIWMNNVGQWNCQPQATYSHNVGTKCSANDTAVNPAASCGRPGCSNPVTAAQGWADPANHDFHLTARSPAINKGDPTVSPSSDRDGTNRPVGGSPDAGAYEYGIGLLAIGDYGERSRPERLGATIRKFEARHAANILVTLGNNDQSQGRAFASSWRSAFGWLQSARVGVAGALGDRDVAVRRGRYQFALLGMAGPYYVRRLRDVELIVLDSSSVSATQTRWLRQTLAQPSDLFRVVVLHRPPYSCGGYLGDSAVRKQWLPLFKRYGVHLVLSGHDNSYQRFTAGPVTYIVAGGGAAAAKRLRRCPGGYPRRRAGAVSQTFLYLTVARDGALGLAVDGNGRTVDRFRVR